MSNLFLHPDQIIKQEQYKELLRDAQNYRLIKDTAQSESNRLQKAGVALRKMMAGLVQHLPRPRPMNRARI